MRTHGYSVGYHTVLSNALECISAFKTNQPHGIPQQLPTEI